MPKGGERPRLFHFYQREERPMQSEFLEIGQIVNTHGIRGEVKLVPWCG